jgi:uncharacterized protein
MKPEFVATRMDVRAFAQANAQLSQQDLLSSYERLMSETGGLGADYPVKWTARGEWRELPGGQAQAWLHLTAHATLPLTCQRCLGPADMALAVDRSFRFVVDEAEAEVQDEEADEDVLVLSQDFNLHELIEDEFLMELPLVPRHEVCPTEVKLQAVDPDFEAASAEKPNPFAALESLRAKKPG